MPARLAARTFSFIPPTGRTSPRRVISPVMATSLRTGLPVSKEVRAVNMVTPAEGPSLGMAPAGTWIWMSLESKKFSGIFRVLGFGPYVAQRRLGRFLHDLPQLTGQGKAFTPLHARGFDEEDVPSGRSPGQAGGHPGLGGSLRHLGEKFCRAKVRRNALGLHDGKPFLTFRHLPGDSPADIGNFPLQIADPGFPGVFQGNPAEGRRRI